MKVRLFNKGKGWYESVTNYKDKEDKAYVNYHFTNHTEPPYEDNGMGYSILDIDLQEWKHSCYKGKVGVTVFRYQFVTKEPDETNMMSESGRRYEPKLNDGNSDMFGGNIDDGLDPNDYPFY